MEIAAIIGLAACAGCTFFIAWFEGLLVSRAKLVCALMLTAAAFLLRAACMNHITLDYVDFLSQWVQYFRDNGGFRALAQPVGNYNLPYLYFLAIFSHSKVNDLYLIKLLSIFFDILLAWGALRLVSVYSGSPLKKAIAFFGALLLPTVILNGSYWGQCDSSYAAFAVWSVYFALRRQNAASIVSVALAFAFKLQAVFVMPVFLIFLYTNRIKIWSFVLFPVTYIITAMPAVIMGRPLLDTLALYFYQTDTVGSGLNYNSPSVFALISREADAGRWSVYGIIAAFLFLAVLFVWFYLRRERVTDRALLCVTLLMVIGIPFLLPHMHDRYFFMADVFSLCAAVALPLMIPAAALCTFASLLGYHAYLRQQYFLTMNYGSLALIIAALFVIVDIFGELHGLRRTKGSG